MTEKTINVFGCSWSSGVSNIEQYTNWVQELARIAPNNTVRNFSIPGIDNKLIYYFYREVTKDKNYERSNNINIIQITSDMRLTILNDEIENLFNSDDWIKVGLLVDKHHAKEIYPSVNVFKNIDTDRWPDNYYELNRVIFLGLGILTPNTPDDVLTKTEMFLRDNYFPRLNDTVELYNSQRLTYGTAFDNDFNVILFHKKKNEDREEIFKNSLTLNNYVSYEEYNNFVEDNGGHFGKQGQEWEAELVKKHLVERNLL